MANPTCTRATLISGAACFREPVISKHQQMARKVYFDMLQLAANGGTDYTSAVRTMQDDAVNLSCGFQPGDFDGAAVVIKFNNAVSAGATVPTDPQVLAQAVRCLEDFDDFVLKQMQLLLDCKLGRAADYPQ